MPTSFGTVAFFNLLNCRAQRVENRIVVSGTTATAGAGRVFSEIKPANTLLVVAQLIDDYCVEIEAEAILRSD